MAPNPPIERTSSRVLRTLEVAAHVKRYTRDRMRALFITAFLIAGGTASAEVEQAPLSLLIPGDYHDDEAPFGLGDGWLALVPSKGSWQLVPALARVERIYDAVLDAEGQTTGVRITVQNAAIALLRTAELHPGKVRTPNMRFEDVYRPLSSTSSPISINFNGSVYEVGVKDSQAYLRNGTRTTLLSDIVVGGPESDDSASLLWAGDLDGDGRLDLLVSYSGYNRWGVCLFMSSKARNAALVRRLACHGGVGC